MRRGADALRGVKYAQMFAPYKVLREAARLCAQAWTALRMTGCGEVGR